MIYGAQEHREVSTLEPLIKDTPNKSIELNKSHNYVHLCKCIFSLQRDDNLPITGRLQCVLYLEVPPYPISEVDMRLA